MVGVLAGPLLWPGTDSSREEGIATTATEQRSVLVNDGSGSSILVDSSSAIRQRQTGCCNYTVELLKGQVAFRMQPNRIRRFHVLVGAVKIDDIGTIFAVRLTGNGEIVVTVAEGLVRIFTPHQPQQILHAYEQATIEFGVRAQRISPSEAREQLSWMDGRVAVQRETLGAIVGRLNRSNRTQIEIPDATVGDIPIGGDFELDHPVHFLRFITSIRPDLRIMKCTIDRREKLRLVEADTALAPNCRWDTQEPHSRQPSVRSLVPNP